MKIVVSDHIFSVAPKQAEGKLYPKHHSFTVKPKPSGVYLYRHDRQYVLKTDARVGVVLKKTIDNKTLKQND